MLLCTYYMHFRAWIILSIKNLLLRITLILRTNFTIIMYFINVRVKTRKTIYDNPEGPIFFFCGIFSCFFQSITLFFVWTVQILSLNPCYGIFVNADVCLHGSNTKYITNLHTISCNYWIAFYIFVRFILFNIYKTT